jgi:hypothetical protein
VIGEEYDCCHLQVKIQGTTSMQTAAIALNLSHAQDSQRVVQYYLKWLEELDKWPQASLCQLLRGYV